MALTTELRVARETDTDTAFGWLFRDEYPAIVRTAYLMLGDRAAAEDVAQEAFIRLYARWRRISRYERPGAWVRRVAIRLASRSLRAGRRTVLQAEVEDPGRTEPVSDPDLRRALLGLPSSQRAAVVLHYFEDRPVAEVAEIMGCATSTAKVHLHRARKRLAEVLGEEEVSDVAG
ncbi:MAG: RNA polymerase sigma factor [Actinomycetota bacterium]